MLKLSKLILAELFFLILRRYFIIVAQEIKVGEAKYLAPECIFKPNTIGKDIDPLDGATVEVLSLCDVNFRRGLCNIILLHGTGVLPGLNERLTLEIKKRFQGFIEVKVISIPEK